MKIGIQFFLLLLKVNCYLLTVRPPSADVQHIVSEDSKVFVIPDNYIYLINDPESVSLRFQLPLE
jgi:hypothetical protein